MRYIKQPKNLSPRVEWLRNYFFEGVEREWNNEYRVFTTGTPWDEMYNEVTYYIVPETFAFMGAFQKCLPQGAKKIDVPADFFKKDLVERRACFVKEAMVNHVPRHILRGDLIAGAVFNLFTSHCLTKAEYKERAKLVYGKNGTRAAVIKFHDTGFGNAGATSGHLIPDYESVLKYGFEHILQRVEEAYSKLTEEEKASEKGAELRAMKTAAEMPIELAEKYSALCSSLAQKESDARRKEELLKMAENLKVVPRYPARDFWQAIQSLWLTHMLVMSDENYPGPGVSFGRLDQYLYPYYNKSREEGMSEEFMKEILGCFWVHCNTAYDAQIRVGANQGITAGFGQLFMISGVGPDGGDLTNDLSYLLLDVIDDMSPILEPKPNVRLHKNSPDKLLDKVVDMIASSQGAPFLINFDERSMAGLLREAEIAGIADKINLENVWNYAAVGCLENTMVGNDRSGTVDINLNLLKAVELALGGNLKTYADALWNKPYKSVERGASTGDPEKFRTFEEFYKAYLKQTEFIVKHIYELYDRTDAVRAKFHPTPYLSLLVKGCIESATDITRGGAEIKFATVEGVTFATTVDSLLAIKYLVFDKKLCTMKELIEALKANWDGYDKLAAAAKYRAPKFGRDDDEADKLARDVMEFWAAETWKYKTTATGVQLRPGMLSWNYWVGDSHILPASPDGRKCGQFLSNAICPSNGADINGPTANLNSVGKALGGKAEKGDYLDYLNCLPNGASHTLTLSPALLRDGSHKEKLKAFLRGAIENGGTALQLNVLDVDTLIDAQKHPEEYRHLLVRVTGYNAYFTSIGRELQNEIIARESHNRF
ncbi:MAG: pyruvate formate lyase family protein [Christensenellales bacterium]|jgi:pyruvate-formate lyase|nr:pyruvate formate lyase family protein [Eubacteriales bacterium]